MILFTQEKISSEALAALAKAFPLYFIIISAGIGIVAGCNSLISNSLGAFNKVAANIYHIIHNICFFLSIFITLIGIYFSYDILKLMGSSYESIIIIKTIY